MEMGIQPDTTKQTGYLTGSTRSTGMQVMPKHKQQIKNNNNVFDGE